MLWNWKCKKYAINSLKDPFLLIELLYFSFITIPFCSILDKSRPYSWEKRKGGLGVEEKCELRRHKQKPGLHGDQLHRIRIQICTPPLTDTDRVFQSWPIWGRAFCLCAAATHSHDTVYTCNKLGLESNPDKAYPFLKPEMGVSDV